MAYILKESCGTCRQDPMELKERQDCLVYDEMECEAKDCNECFMVEEEDKNAYIDQRIV